MSTKRSAKYWREFGARAELKATRVDTGKPVLRPGRGAFLMETALKMIAAGLWKDVQVRQFGRNVWIPIEEIKYVPFKERMRR